MGFGLCWWTKNKALSAGRFFFAFFVFWVQKPKKRQTDASPKIVEVEVGVDPLPQLFLGFEILAFLSPALETSPHYCTSTMISAAAPYPLSTSAYVNLIHERPTPSSATAMAMGVACRWKPPPLPGDAIILRSAAANRQPPAAAYCHTTITIFTAKAKDSPYARHINNIYYNKRIGGLMRSRRVGAAYGVWYCSKSRQLFSTHRPSCINE